MSTDFWPTLHSDPYALARLRKSCELLDAKPGMSVLDVGCHQGEARQFLKDVEYQGLDALTGHDIDGELDPGYGLGQWDRILCLEVLEHLNYPRKTLASIAFHLKKDGVAVISLPNEATLFHRLRSLLGVVDAECFSESGKHLHLPSLKQCVSFLESNLQIVSKHYYIAPTAAGSRQAWLGAILRIIPDSIHQLLADFFPSMFARGFIFVCKKK